MKPLTLADIPPPEVFAAARDTLRERTIAHKAARRVAVGPRVTLLFEDRETVRWQVLEMCRVEGTRDPAGVQHELDAYNELVPGEGELSATLFIEITDLAEIRPELDRLIGMDEHVLLQVGDRSVRAGFDPKQLDEDRIAAVQYIRFPLGEATARAFADPAVPARIAIDHPNYHAEAALEGATRDSLVRDLAGGVAPLVDFSTVAPATAAAPECLLERDGFRVLAPVAPRAAGHRVIEAQDPSSTFAELDEKAAGALLALAQELAREVTAAHGSCRVSIDAAARPVRVDVYAP